MTPCPDKIILCIQMKQKSLLIITIFDNPLNVVLWLYALTLHTSYICWMETNKWLYSITMVWGEWYTSSPYFNVFKIQLNLAISNSVISNTPLSRTQTPFSLPLFFSHLLSAISNCFPWEFNKIVGFNCIQYFSKLIVILFHKWSDCTAALNQGQKEMHQESWNL